MQGQKGGGGRGRGLWVWPLLHLSQATNTVTLSRETHVWAADVRTSTRYVTLKGEFVVTWGWGTRFETWSLVGWKRGTRVESSGWVSSSMESPASSRYTDIKINILKKLGNFSCIFGSDRRVQSPTHEERFVLFIWGNPRNLIYAEVLPPIWLYIDPVLSSTIFCIHISQ
jgi:hypothetical protein